MLKIFPLSLLLVLAIAPTAQASDPLGPRAALTVAVGDIACDSPIITAGCNAGATALLAASIKPSKIWALGDLVYNSGSLAEFQSGYAPTWGIPVLKSKTFPVPGNHEYNTANAQGYKDYWGAQAQPNGVTWHSARFGDWLVLGLDSNCSVVGCDASSPQGLWLHNKLAHAPKCIMAIWHHPRRSSGLHGDNPAVQPLWYMLAAAHADLVLSGHDHHYERFATLNSQAQPAAGVRQFVVGTGGKQLYGVPTVGAGSLVRVMNHSGVLKLDLRSNGYRWRFVGTNSFTIDRREARCRA